VARGKRDGGGGGEVGRGGGGEMEARWWTFFVARRGLYVIQGRGIWYSNKNK
jgi:hypothetical protein